MKKNNKVLLVVAIVIVLVAILVCGGYFMMLHLVKSNALKAIDEMFVALKSADVSKLKEYVDVNENVEEENIEANQGNKIVTTLLNDLSYEVVSSEVKLDKCIVTLNVTNKNIKTVLSNYITNLFSLAFSNAFGKITDEEMNIKAEQYLEEQYNSESIDKISSQITLTFIKDNGEWKLDYYKDQLLNTILPGYKEAIESLNTVTEQ